MKIIGLEKTLEKGVELLNEKYALSDKDIFVEVSKTEEKGYSLQKNEKGYRIEYSEECYFFNAFGLLISGVENAQRREYAPKLGIMMDCARNAVPTVAFVKQYLQDAVLMGYDYIGLYLEDLLEVEGEPYLGWKRGRYSEKEIKEIIEYADIFGVEIVPYMETLAHMDAMFRCPFWANYNQIFDFRDCLLAGEEQTYEFLDRLIGAVAKYFKTKRIHIGMDEAGMAGRGHYLNKHGVVDKHKLLFDHLDRVLTICEKYGLKPEMWADMIVKRKNPEEDEKVLKDEKKLAILKRVKLIYWDYYHDDAETYKSIMQRTAALTDNYGFAGAGWGYVGLTPLNAFGNKNTQAAMTACQANKVENVCMTLWGDLSGEGSFYSTIPTLLLAVSNATDGGLSKEDMSKLTMLLFNYTYDELMETDLPNSVKDNVRNNTAFCLMTNDVLLDLMGLMADYGYDEKYKKITARLKELATRESKISYVFEALYKMTYCLEIKSVITLWLKDAYKAGNKKELLRLAQEVLPELIIRTKAHLKNMQSHWLKEKKSYGLDNVAMRISAGICQMEYAIDRIKAYVNGEIEKIEEYEEMELKYFSFWGDESYRDKNLVVYTDWYNMVTNSRFHFSNNPYAG